MIDFIKTIRIASAMMLGSCLYILWTELRTTKKAKKPCKKKHSDFQKKYFEEENE